MSLSSINPQTMIHAGVECVIIGGLAFWVNRRISPMETSLEEITKKIKALEIIVEQQHQHIMYQDAAIRQILGEPQSVRSPPNQTPLNAFPPSQSPSSHGVRPPGVPHAPMQTLSHQHAQSTHPQPPNKSLQPPAQPVPPNKSLPRPQQPQQPQKPPPPPPPEPEISTEALDDALNEELKKLVENQQELEIDTLVSPGVIKKGKGQPGGKKKSIGHARNKQDLSFKK